LHVLPRLGGRRIDSVTRQDVRELVERLRVETRLAPKTVRNVYGTLRTLFRDAVIEELVPVDPGILPRGTLPSPRELSQSSSRRSPSIFTREEVVVLLTDLRVPVDRRTFYAAGDIVDRYTTFDWEPLCEAVGCLQLPMQEGPEDQALGPIEAE
jgi:integrase